MKSQITSITILLASAVAPVAGAMTAPGHVDLSASALRTVGKGDTYVSADGTLMSSGSYAVFGEPDMKNYRMTFRARAPRWAEQAQIWAGFNAANRYDRYVVGIKGGLQDDIFLARLGYMGTDEFLDLRPLGFHPEPGEWVEVKIEQVNGRIRVYLNGDTVPHIDVTDNNANLASAGRATLGGGWIPTEYDKVEIEALDDNYFDGVPVKVKDLSMTAERKAQLRREQRGNYAPRTVNLSQSPRTTVSLDGDWLFMPTYETDDEKAKNPESDDSSWHVMTVPQFWNPSRIWLHGETMGTPAGHRSKGVSDTYYQSESERCENYTFDYRRTDGAWYRQWVELPSDINGKKVTLDFEGVSKICDIYINGQQAANHVGMFGNFTVDGSQYFRPGRNLIAVKVLRNAGTSGEIGNDALEIYYSASRDNSARTESGANVSRNILAELPHGFYGDNPAGIWRPVKLTVSNPVTVEDVFIRPSLTGAEFDIVVANNSRSKGKFDIVTRITDHSDGSLLYEGVNVKGITLAGGASDSLTYAVGELTPKLWSPSSPSLYDFTFEIRKGGRTIDSYNVRSGFRTFEVRDGQFWLNGSQYALRGGNHTPFALAPNDRRLADNFYRLMKEGNLEVTRTHTCPYNQLWMDAADENGIGVSYEGTWSWLYIHDTMPSDDMVDFWEAEWLQLMKSMRNHPSLLFWTVNNEMKFYDLDPDFERCKRKFVRISDAVRHMRAVDPTRPVCFDSNYQAKGKEKKFGAEFMASVDDGDIDDVHSYINWYDHSLFRYFKGELQRDFKLPHRPLISQEMSTGYPNNETGHSTRSYTLQHQNPQSLIGLDCYEFSDPAKFLKVQSFITGELAEALRRSNDQASGTIHFALLTWFKQVYDADKVSGWPTYYAMRRAMQPVLVSAELWGRHLYAGEDMPVRFCIVNDDIDGNEVEAGSVEWRLKDATGHILASGTEKTPAVPHCGRAWIEPSITLPSLPGSSREETKFELSLVCGGREISSNVYDLTVATRDWASVPVGELGSEVVLVDNDGIGDTFDSLGVNYRKAENVTSALRVKGAPVVISGADNLSEEDATLLRSHIAKGRNVLFLRGEEGVKSVFPEYIAGTITPTEGDIVNMDVPESAVFDSLDYFDLRYFNDNRREIPKVCDKVYQIHRDDSHVTPLAMQQKIHGYIDGDMLTRSRHVETIRGFALLDIAHGDGRALVSSLSTDKAKTDPVAGRLLANMLRYISK